jgi:thiol-disulfide isomerase/thioredoxin
MSVLHRTTSSITSPFGTLAVLAACFAPVSARAAEPPIAPPSLAGAVGWLNSPPLTLESLRGKVVLVDFWTYSCINCLRTLPHVRAWAERYAAQGLVVVGVHTPEFAFEKNLANIQRAMQDLKIGFPVAVDSNFAVWRSFQNRAWPAFYLVDAQGRIRHQQYGEGDFDATEKMIQALLKESGTDAARKPMPSVALDTRGVGLPPDMANAKSPETYVGYQQAESFASPGGIVRQRAHAYTPGTPRLNEWGLSGEWTVQPEFAELNRAGGSVVVRFHARDLHLVLGRASAGMPLRFRLTLDGKPPDADHGVDTDADGNGVIDAERLYQLVRQQGRIGDRTIEIRFLDPGARAFAFTFG